MKNLVEKWKDILESEGAPKFKSKKIKQSTALMLENQFKHLQKEGYRLDEGNTTTYSGTQNAFDPSGSGYSGDGMFHKVAIPMVRRTFPNLIAHEIVGVQPLQGPVGIAFALRFQAGQTGQEYDGDTNVEIGHNTIDKDYTGPETTSDGEELGSYSGSTGTPAKDQVGLGVDGDPIPEVSSTLEKETVEAKTRKLRSRWSLEVAQDIEAMHGLDIESELMDTMSYELSAEIDRELIHEIRSLFGGAGKNIQTASYEDDFDGRWESEKQRNMYNWVVRMAGRIAISTRRGPANWIVADPNPAAMLEALSNFNTHPISSDVDTSQFGVARIGNIEGRFTVYRDTFHDKDEMLLGFKGASEYDTGVIYLPYIQLMLNKVTDYNSFQPTMGIMSRYAVMKNIFGAASYYERLKVKDLFTYES